jgi:hypothetical protein
MKSIQPTLLALALCTVFASSAMAQTMSKAQHSAASDNISSEYKIAKEKCASLAGHAKDVCTTDAKANEKIAQAKLDVQYHSTASTRNKSRIHIAEAQYDMDKVRCNDKAGNLKDVCIQQAKTTQSEAIADSKLKMKTTDANVDAKVKVDDAKHAADDTKREAQLKLAKEKCDALAGAAKDTCVGKANMEFGKK